MQKENKIIVLTVVLILLSVTIPQFVYKSNDTLWNVFYERQAKNVFDTGHLNEKDDLSYLGRENSFVPGYFAAKALFLKLFGLSFDNFSKILFGFLMNIILLISIFYFGKNYKIENISIFMLIFISTTFIFVLLAGNLMHVLSLSLLFFSLSMKDEKKSGIVLGLSCIVHAFSFILFPLMSYKKDKNKIIKSLIIGALVFLLFYGPTLLKLGAPNELYPDQYGYLTNWGLSAIPGEFFLLTPLLIVSIFYCAYRKDYFNMAMIILFSLLYAYLSFRVIIILAFYLALALAKLSKENKWLLLFILFIVIINFFVLTYRMSGLTEPCKDGYVSELCAGPIDYINMYTSSSSKIAVDPILGHLTEFYTQRKVLADLYVEYADYNKLKTEIDYENTGNSSLLENYNISYAITKNTCDNQVYDNGYYRVCTL